MNEQRQTTLVGTSQALLAAVLCLGGCGLMRPHAAPPPPEPPSIPAAVHPATAAPAPAAAAPADAMPAASPAAVQAAQAAQPPPPVAPIPRAAASAASPPKSALVGAPKSKAAQAAAAPQSAAAAPSPPAAKPAVAHAAGAPPPPPLDLAGLEQRLKDTHAIGIFTKLSLKNQVDDLLAAVSAYHGGAAKTSLTGLRQQYDLLLLKVLTLLQDGDPPLASAISASREALWSILADADKFHKIQLG